jgi:Protein of unknown function (DUF1569)
LIGFSPKNLQVSISREAGKILKLFFIDQLFGVIAAAIKRKVDREYYISYGRFTQFRHSRTASTAGRLPISRRTGNSVGRGRQKLGIIWASESEFQTMQNLESVADREEILRRIGSLTAADQRRWGKMTAHQALCHLSDAFRVALGEKSASPASGIFQRTIMKWVALWGPFHWPHGVPTRPETEQGKGGTPPVEFERDRGELLAIVPRFCDQGPNPSVAHHLFGRLDRKEWMRWGYLHTDHHLRQFGR